MRVGCPLYLQAVNDLVKPAVLQGMCQLLYMVADNEADAQRAKDVSAAAGAEASAGPGPGPSGAASTAGGAGGAADPEAQGGAGAREAATRKRKCDEAVERAVLDEFLVIFRSVR